MLILLLEIVIAADTCARDAVARECAGEEGADSAVDEALEQYKREGWAVMKGVIDPALMEEVRDHVEYLLAKYPDIPGGRAINSVRVTKKETCPPIKETLAQGGKFTGNLGTRFPRNV